MRCPFYKRRISQVYSFYHYRVRINNCQLDTHIIQAYMSVKRGDVP